MAPVTVVTAVYVADTSRYVAGVNRAVQATQQFNNALPEAEKSTGRLAMAGAALGAGLATLGAIGFARASAAIKQYAMQGIQAAAQYEQTVISMTGIFQGSGMSMQAAAAKTESYLADLRDFAARTPFELPQTLDAVKRLLSIGYTADEVKNDILPTVGDITAALGQPASAINGVVYAFGQMKSAGRVLSQDLMQIGNALPGFNAKMAIANEMFGGNLQQMQIAMERGTVSSEQAIQAMLAAMQKFPGAAGAMERQSRSLLGVMSTFKDTVNNALIDGLMPAIPSLSGALEELVGPLSDVATAFAQNLGPAMIAGVGAVKAMAPVLTDVIPPMLELISATSAFSEVVVALAPVISVAADGLGIIANAVSMIPAPLMVAAGAILLFRRATARFGVEVGADAAKSSGAFARFSQAVRVHMRAANIETLAAARSMAAGMQSVTAAALTMNAAVARTTSPFNVLRSTAAVTATGVKGAFMGMATAARGFMAALGPVGIALGAAAAIMEVFSGQAAGAKMAVDSLRENVDLTTQSLNKMGDAWMAAHLRENISQEDIDALAQYGFAWDEILNAIGKGGPEWDALKARMDAVGETLIGTSSMSFDTMQRTIEGARHWAAASVDAANVAAAANEDAARRSGEAALRERDQMIGAVVAAEQERRAAYEKMTTAERIAADAHRSAVQAYKAGEDERASAARKGADAVIKAGQSILAMFDRLRGITSMRSARSSWAKALSGIGEALNEAAAQGEKGTMKAGGRGFDALTTAMDASIAMAEQMKPAKRAAFLAKAAERIEREFAKSGQYKVPAKGKIKEQLLARAGVDVGGQMTNWNSIIDATVKDVNKAQRIEKGLNEQGISGGVKFTDGLLEALRQGEDPIVAASAALGKAAAKAFTDHGYVSLTGVYPTEPSMARPGTPQSGGQVAMVNYTYQFTGDIQAGDPAAAARQADKMVKLTRLGKGRNTDAHIGSDRR